MNEIRRKVGQLHPGVWEGKNVTLSQKVALIIQLAMGREQRGKPRRCQEEMETLEHWALEVEAEHDLLMAICAEQKLVDVEGDTIIIWDDERDVKKVRQKK